MLRRYTAAQMKGPEKTHDRRKARTLLVRIHFRGGFRAAERQQPLQLCAICADDIVIQIPGGHAERFAPVEVSMQVRRLEIGER